MLSPKNTRRAQNAWSARKHIAEKIPGMHPTGNPLLLWTLASLPATDLGDYPLSLLESFAQEAAYVREAFPWCRELPEELFLLHVLCPRINNETLSDCRPVFRQELEPLVRGLTLPEAIQRVNAWCAGRVVYRSTDERTSSPLEIYHRGWGRCGEESLFTVNALRSVGIAARQIYAPWWSHCDDNHAWVEAWDGRRWRYLGACEPEPLLDRGWFTQAAGRAMLIHARAFVGDLEPAGLFPGVRDEALSIREGVAYESVTRRYAETRDFTIEVQGPGAAGAKVGFYILNEGALRPIAWRTADERGLARIELGLGSIWICGENNGFSGNVLAYTGEAERAVVELKKRESAFAGEASFIAPKDSGLQVPALSPEQKERRARTLHLAKTEREARKAPQPCPPTGDPALLRAYALLTPKDRAANVPLAVLEDCREAYRFERGLPEDVFAQGLLSPRIGHEPLAPWRALLEKEAPLVPPEKLWNWLCENITQLDSFQDIPQTIAGAWRLRAANRLGMKSLFCGICRSRGIPARLGAGGRPEYWRDGWRLADGMEKGWAAFPVQGESGGRLGLMIWDSGWQPVDPAQSQLPEGRWLWTAATRLPNGNQLVNWGEFWLGAGEKAEIQPVFRKGRPEDFLQSLTLPDAAIRRGGTETPLQELLGTGDLTLACWTEPGAEPTQHLMLELEEWAGELRELDCRVEILTEAVEAAEAVARRMYLEPGVLPLALLADKEGKGLFALAGYRVGAGEMLTQAARAYRAAKGRGTAPRGLAAKPG